MTHHIDGSRVQPVDEEQTTPFFLQSSTNAKTCLDILQSLFSSTTCAPLALNEQGCFSYTVEMADENGRWIVQLRLPRNHTIEDLKTILCSSARLFPEWIPFVHLEERTPFIVWRMKYLPGIKLMHFLGTSEEPDLGLYHRVEVCAIILARSTNEPTETTTDHVSDIESRLAKIADPTLQALVSNLPLYNMTKLPTVLTHMDLTELNILVDHKTGVVTGVIDWQDAEYLPLGCGLYALHILLGTQYRSGWSWHQDRALLEQVFWSVFWSRASDDFAHSKEDKGVQESLRVAGQVGILLKFADSISNPSALVRVKAFLELS